MRAVLRADRLQPRRVGLHPGGERRDPAGPDPHTGGSHRGAGWQDRVPGGKLPQDRPGILHRKEESLVQRLRQRLPTASAGEETRVPEHSQFQSAQCQGQDQPEQSKARGEILR